MTKLEKVFVSWYGQDEWDKWSKNKEVDYTLSKEEQEEAEEFRINDIVENAIESILGANRIPDQVESWIYDILEGEVTKEDLYVNYNWYSDIMIDYIVPDCMIGNNREYIEII